MREITIRARGLGKTYRNGVKGLQDLDLDIRRSEIHALLGPNGSGKTTTVRLFNGSLEPSAGTVHINGASAQDEGVRARCATMSEDALMYERMTLLENLRFYGRLYGMDVKRIASRSESLIEILRLGGREKDRLATFSTGMKKRASLARALLHEPEILFLDEPTSGLDPQAAREVMSLIQDLARGAGCTVLICTHNLALVDEICDTISFIKQGTLVASGSREHLVNDLITTRELCIEQVSGPALTLQFNDETEINGILQRLIAGGTQIRGVRIAEPDLEAIYAHYIGGTQTAGSSE